MYKNIQFSLLCHSISGIKLLNQKKKVTGLEVRQQALNDIP